MHKRLTGRAALTTLLAAAALAGAVAPAATAAPAAEPVACDLPYNDPLSVRYLDTGKRLEPGQSLVSSRKTTALVMQADGNLVLYVQDPSGTGTRHPLWNSGTYGNPGAYALMQEDGNFVVYKKDGGPDKGGALWATKTWGTAQAKARLEADGEFTVWGNEGAWVKWSSMTHEESPMLCTPGPGAPYRDWLGGSFAQSASVYLVLQEDRNLVMYRKRDGAAIWNSASYGSDKPVVLQVEASGDVGLRQYYTHAWAWHTGTENNRGAYALLQDDGNFVVYAKDGGPGKGGALWSSGTYNKI
ncbi:hypothetical protein [Streptomyces sp. CLCI03]